MKYGVVGTKLICGYGDKKIEYTSANRIIISQGKMDKYIVIIKSEVENSEFNACPNSWKSVETSSKLRRAGLSPIGFVKLKTFVTIGITRFPFSKCSVR